MTESRWTVRDILNKYNTLGLPHFQRGLVWNTETVSLLLESLYYNTPCGSIILWKPENPAEYGVKLPGATEINYLIIDGQQRVRNIHDALKDITEEIYSEEIEQGDESEKRERVWCLNLARIPELAEYMDKNIYFEKSLFLLMADPGKAGEGSSIVRNNVVPLQWILTQENPFASWKYLRGINGDRNALVQAAEKINLKDRLRAIFDREFFIITKIQNGDEHNLPKMVELYNRINSGGVRVQAEERAFATMVSIYPKTNKWVKDLFKQIHGEAGSDDEAEQRDRALRRIKERNFGFKLFIRTFVQAASYHFGYSLGSSSLSFAVTNGHEFQEYLGNATKANELFGLCRGAIADVAEIIQGERLLCDSLQFLPETASLVPVFQLLFKYPDLAKSRDPKNQNLVALYILKLLLAEKNQRKVLEIARAVAESNKLEECYKIIGELSLNDIRGRLKTSESLQDRYVLLLYWLIRRNGAKDFNYKQLGDKKLYLANALYPEHEQIIQKGCNPEKQHIVPYSKLKKVYDIHEEQRINKHEINSIGNLTYISQKFNGFDYGLGDMPLVFEGESNKVLAAHFLSPDAVTVYNELICQLNSEPQKKDEIKRSFNKFCDIRERLIADAFETWVAQLEQESAINEDVESRTEPVSRIFKPSVQDRLRILGYNNEVEDCLLRLVAHPEMRQVNVSGDPDLLRYEGKKGKKKLFHIDFKPSELELVMVGGGHLLIESFWDWHDAIKNKIRLTFQDRDYLDYALDFLEDLERLLGKEGMSAAEEWGKRLARKKAALAVYSEEDQRG